MRERTGVEEFELIASLPIISDKKIAPVWNTASQESTPGNIGLLG